MPNSFQKDNPELPASMHITATQPRPFSMRVKKLSKRPSTPVYTPTLKSQVHVMGTGNPDQFLTVRIYETNCTLNIYPA